MKPIITLLALMLAATSVWAHFPILTPSAPFADVDQDVHLTFSVGHPFEQEYENAAKPEALYAILPSGKKSDLLPLLQEGTRASGDTTVINWRLTYKPVQKGDTVLALNTAPDTSGDRLYQEFLKVALHVDQQDGWRQRTGQPLEIVPLTRPYGLEAGDVFTARLMKGESPVPDAEIYVEILNTTAPKPEEIPAEPFVTKVVVTDPNGVFTSTLPKEGWWICGAYVDEAGIVKREGHDYTLSGFAGLWVYVGKP